MSLRRLSGTALCVASALATGCARPAEVTESSSRRLLANELVLVDANGTVRARLSAGSVVPVGLAAVETASVPLPYSASIDGQSPGLELFDADGHRRVVVALRGDGRGAIAILNANGAQELVVAPDAHGRMLVRAFDRNGTPIDK